MNKKTIQILCAALVISTGANVYLFMESRNWRAAWVNQFFTTSEIENILKASGADTSMTSIQKSAEHRLGAGPVQIVDVDDVHLKFGVDSKGLNINTTLILFKDGSYHGSKANLPSII